MSMKHITMFALFASLFGCRGAVDAGRADAGADTATSPTNNGNNPTGDTGVRPPNNVTPRDIGPTGSDVAVGRDVTEPPFDAGVCGGAGFGTAFAVTAIAGTQAQGQLLHAAATSAGGAVVGWAGADGIHVTHVDGAGNVINDTTVAGDQLFGLAAHDDGRAVMVSRGSDILALVILDGSHNPVSDQTIIGDVPHTVTENEWFGPLIRQGTMTWTGTQWATYFAVQRLWNDGVAHYGDQLRLYEADGSSNSMVWGWGCSHSMEVKISHNGEGLGAMCSSDCFPSKGVHFNNRGGQLWPDETGSNCAGQWGTSLGASVPIPGGFWLAFTATDDRQSHDVAIARVDGATPSAPIWLTDDAVDDRQLRATNFEDDVVLAWNAGNTNQFVIADGVSGAVSVGPVTVAGAVLAGSSDFFAYANGDIGWAQNEGGAVGLARLRACR